MNLQNKMIQDWELHLWLQVCLCQTESSYIIIVILMSLENGQAFLEFDPYLYVRERVLGLGLILICNFCQFIEIFCCIKAECKGIKIHWCCNVCAFGKEEFNVFSMPLDFSTACKLGLSNALWTLRAKVIFKNEGFINRVQKIASWWALAFKNQLLFSQ